MKNTSTLFKTILFSVLFVASFSIKSQTTVNVNTNFPSVNNSVNAVVWDSLRNRIYIGGAFTTVNGSVRSRFAALDATTGALLSWTLTFNGTIQTMKMYKNMLYVGGSFSTVSGNSRNGIVKLNLNTQTVTTWTLGAGGGGPANGNINDLDAAGKYLFVAGSFLTPTRLCRADTGTGVIDSWASGLDNTVNAIDVNGTDLYVGGSFTSAGSGQSRSYAAAYNVITGATPTLDPNWDPQADVFLSAVKYFGGQVYVSGNFSIIGGQVRTKFAGLNPAGTIGDASSLDVQLDGRAVDIACKNNSLFMCGFFTTVTVGSTVSNRNGITELDIPAGVVTKWYPSPADTYITVNTLGNNTVYVGGVSLTTGGVTNLNVFCANFANPIYNDINFTVNPNSVCAGQTQGVLYGVDNTSGAASYSWSNSVSGVTITNATKDSATMNFSGAAAGTDVISVHGSNGCINTNTVSVSVNIYTFAPYTSPSTGSISCGDSIQINTGDNYTGSGTISYSWTPSTGLNNTTGNQVTSGTKTTRTYTLTETSSDGCVGKDVVTITVNPYNLNTSMLTSSIMCSTTDSLYVTNDYVGFGTVTYTWSPSVSVSAQHAANTSVNPIVSTDYTVTSTSTDGCVGNPQIISVVVNPISLSAGSTSSNIVCGEITQLSASNNYPGAGTLTYTWSPSTALSNTHITNPNANPIASTDYTITMSSPEGCVSTDVTTISVSGLQVNTLGTYSVVCHQPVTLNTSVNTSNPGLTYSWTPSTGLSSTTSANPSASVYANTNYNVTVSLPSSGCANATAPASITLITPSAPDICMVTVDSLSKNNLIVWDKTLYPTADTFYVYRDTANNNYCIVGRISRSALSEYADTARHIGNVNGDPNITTYRYKLAYRDSCGNVSPMSPFHNTIYQYNSGSLFLWNQYQIEGQVSPVPGLSNYVLKRDNVGGTGNYVTAATAGAAATSINDPQYSTYQSSADWRVETVWSISCTPSYLLHNNSTQAAIIKSKSNITNNRMTGVKNSDVVNSFSLYPNPTNGNLTIAFANSNNGKVSVRVVSVIGQEAYNETFVPAGQLHNIDLSKCESGVYLVQITTNNNTVTKRIVKN